MSPSSDTPRRVSAKNKTPRRRQTESQAPHDQASEATPADESITANVSDAPTTPRTQPPTPTGKLAVLVTLMSQPQGADIGAMMDATGWQAHSVHGALAGALKRRFGLTIVSAKEGGPRTYRIDQERDR